MSNGTFFRVHKNKNYTVMSNHHLQDPGLSLKAKGLLSIMLSLPDDWDFSKAGLVKIVKEGRSSVESALSELKQAGYLKIERQHVNGRIAYSYHIFEIPNVQNKCTDEHTDSNSLYTKIQHTQNLYTVNVQQLNTKEQNTKKQSTNKLNDTKVSLDKSKKSPYGDEQINEMFELWEKMFGYMPKQSRQNRFAAYNMLRANNKGRDWLIKTMTLLLEAQKDKYAGNAVLGISGFADLQYSYDKVWKWGSGKAMRNSEAYENIEI